MRLCAQRPVQHPYPTTVLDLPPAEREFRPDIQGLRAVAVVLVVLYHAGVPFLRGGYVGVDVFFVISGFLITRQLLQESEQTGKVSLLRFYGRRMRRLLPAAAFVVVATVLATRLWTTASETVALVKDVAFSAVYAMNYHLAVEGVNYQQSSTPPSPLQHFWSLAVEEQFYIVWPVLVAACTLVGYRYRRFVLGTILLGLLGGSFAAAVTLSQSNTPMAYFSGHTRAWELALGAVVAMSSRWLLRIPAQLAALLSWPALGAIVLSAFVYSDRTLYPGVAAMLPVVATAVLIATGCRRTDASTDLVLDRPFMQYTGKTSYAWYLWHWPMLLLLPRFAGEDLSWRQNLIIVVLAFWAATLTYFLENASLRSKLRLGAWIPTGAALSTVGVAAALLAAVSAPALAGTGAARTAPQLTAGGPTAVQAALRDGLTIRALPRNLTPSLLVVGNEVPNSINRFCIRDITSLESVPCVFGDPRGSKTAVLLGDSHANQWLPGLEAPARASGWKILVWTKAACPLADLPVYSPQLRRLYTECARWRSAVLPQIKAVDPDLLIASQSDAVAGGEYTSDEWAKRTVNTLSSLVPSTTPIAFIGDSPTTKVDPVRCLAQHTGDASLCSFPVGEAFDIAPGSADRRVVVRRHVEAARFSYIDPLPWFCAERCPAVVGNMLVRRDTGHITSTYARWLAPMFMPLFGAQPAPSASAPRP